VLNIEWIFSPYSVIKEKSNALLRKTLASGDIVILTNSDGAFTNRIQVTIKNTDTNLLSGAFLHQIVVTDSAGTVFVPFEGIMVINRKIAVA
jgi:hypothetical protein